MKASRKTARKVSPSPSFSTRNARTAGASETNVEADVECFGGRKEMVPHVEVVGGPGRSRGSPRDPPTLTLEAPLVEGTGTLGRTRKEVVPQVEGAGAGAFGRHARWVPPRGRNRDLGVFGRSALGSPPASPLEVLWGEGGLVPRAPL